MLVEDHAIAVEGATLRTRSVGDIGARPLLFLHGGLGSLEDFDPVVTRLEGVRLVLVDSRGHGGSTFGGTLGYERLALDAEVAIDHFRLKRPVVVGYSDGGIAAIRMAAARRRDLSGLVLLGTDADMPAPEIVDGIFAQLTPQGWRTKFPDDVARYERLNPEPDFDRLFHEVRRMWCDPASGNYPGRLVEDVACRALVLSGDRDHLVSRSVTLDLARRIPDADLGILPFAGHAIFRDQPDAVVSCLNRFIEKLG